jgi:hypothetical protein
MFLASIFFFLSFAPLREIFFSYSPEYAKIGFILLFTLKITDQWKSFSIHAPGTVTTPVL